MRVRALTAIVDGGYTTRQYGEEFETSEANALAWIASGAVEPVAQELDTAVSPKHKEAERAVRFGGTGKKGTS